MTSLHELLNTVYAAFNARDLEAVLAMMDPDVDWPNGMEGGRVHGRAGVRDYWTRQWSLIDPRVEPVGFATDEAGRIIADVHQTIRDLSGKVIIDQMVQHIYTFHDGLIARMDIKKTD
jgi:hypothetical protein